MKKIINNNRVIALAFFTMFAMGAASSAMAGEKNPLVPVEMKFLGLVSEQPLFQLSFFGSALQNEFTITIADQSGNTLYNEKIKGENFTKKFLLNTEELGDNTLVFVVFCNKTKKSVVYEVNRNTRRYQDVAIIERN